MSTQVLASGTVVATVASVAGVSRGLGEAGQAVGTRGATTRVRGLVGQVTVVDRIL